MLSTLNDITEKESTTFIQITELKLKQKNKREAAEREARFREQEEARRFQREEAEKERQHKERMMMMQIELAKVQRSDYGSMGGLSLHDGFGSTSTFDGNLLEKLYTQ
jgi:hypothetical protein